jgi:hypothetical protein
MATTIFITGHSLLVKDAAWRREMHAMLQYSMEYCSFLMYKREASRAGRALLKNGAGTLTGPAPPGYRTDGGVGWLAGARCS